MQTQEFKRRANIIAKLYPEAKKNNPYFANKLKMNKDKLFEEYESTRKSRNVKDIFACVDRENLDVRDVRDEGAAEYVAKVLEAYCSGRLFPFEKDKIHDLCF